MKARIVKLFRLVGVLLPGFSLILAAFLVAAIQHDARQLARVSETARLTAAAIDLRLSKILEVTEYCAFSPDLVERLNLTAVRENCGRYALMIGAWLVIVETGDTHRQILNTRPDISESLPVYARTEERAELLELEAQSRATGRPGLARVFRGIFYSGGIIAGGQFVRLADGREVMIYVNLPVLDLSEQLAQLAAGDSQALGLVDPSRRIVARSESVERAIFTDIPPWFAPRFEAAQAGAAKGVPGPEAIGGRWDAGYHPLAIAPGWMVVAVQPATHALSAWRLFSPASVLAVSGLVLSGLLMWMIADRDRNRAVLAASEQARAVAEQRNQEKSRLLASFAHDIRSPLISLVGSLDLLEKTTDSRIRTARSSAESLLQLVDAILELAFLGSGAFALHPSPVDLRSMAVEQVDQVSAFATRKGLALHLDLDPALPAVVEVDRLRLQQVLSNLLANAVKYTQSGAVTLQIRVLALDGKRATLGFSVVDTGIGLAPEDIPCVLSEYGRLDRDAERREGGTGLGLAIVQRVLQAMGAALTVDSTPGKGAAFGFSVILPVLECGLDTTSAQPLSGVKILLVEDEPVIRRITVRRLVGAGAQVIEAADGADALARLADLRPDLLLVDLQMPVLDGIGLIRRLRAGGGPSRFPIFVLTSHIVGPQAEEARAAGADIILTKPVQIEPLAVALRMQQVPASKKPPGAEGEALAEAVALVDTGNLSDLFGMMDHAAATALLAEFEGGLRQDLARLVEAVRNANPAEAARQAHRCLGLCQVMGAIRLSGRFGEFETRAKTGDIQDMAVQAGALHGLIEETLVCMRTLLPDPRRQCLPKHTRLD